MFYLKIDNFLHWMKLRFPMSSHWFQHLLDRFECGLEQDHREILMTLHGNYVNDSCKRDRTISFYLWYQCMRWNIECRWGLTVTLGWNSHSDWLIRILEWNSPSESLIGILGWNSHSHWSEFWICIHREIKLDVLSVDLKHNFIMMAYCSISLNSI